MPTWFKKRNNAYKGKKISKGNKCNKGNKGKKGNKCNNAYKCNKGSKSAEKSGKPGFLCCFRISCWIQAARVAS